MRPGTKLAETLNSGRLALTAQCIVSDVADAEGVRRLAADFPSMLDALVICDGDREASLSALACSSLLASQGLEPVLAVSTRDRNRIALLSDIRGAAMLGVGNVLCLAGDHQSLGPQPEAAGAYDIDSVQLIYLLREMGDDASGRALLIGAEAYPHLRPLELALLDARKKVAAGAQFLLTQPVFDLTAFDEWMTAARAEGLPERAAIIAGVQPLAGLEHAEALRRRRRVIPEPVLTRLRDASEPEQEGIAICAETAAALKGIQGVRGVHVYWGGAPNVVAEVMTRAALAPA
ncbi:MAG: methylenetetrahydrofolate reductase [Dehalococcoidia bacterium]|jgi:methylenetetrahydrofolate reductase (NADPH)